MKGGSFLFVSDYDDPLSSMPNYTTLLHSYGFVPLVEVFLALGIISAAIFSWRDFFGFGPVVTMAFFAAGFGVFLNSRFMYYSHQYYKIASDPISVSMIITTIGMIGMLFFELISAFMSWEKER